jgi:hypothetical protein
MVKGQKDMNSPIYDRHGATGLDRNAAYSNRSIVVRWTLYSHL